MVVATLNSILQAAGVVIAVGVCVVYVVKRIFHKSKSSEDCSGCPLAGVGVLW